MTKEEIEKALNKGKHLTYKTVVGDIVISKGSDSLMRWLNSGPHGEAAQDSIDNRMDYDEYYDEY